MESVALGVENFPQMETLPFQDTEFVSSCLNLARSTPTTIEIVLDLIQSYRRSGTLIDLGCGEGFFLHAASKRGFSATGVEIDEQLVSEAQILNPGVSILLQDMYTTDLIPFDVIYCYLYQKNLLRLRKRLEERLRQRDALVVSLLYEIPQFRPIQVHEGLKIYIYDSSSIRS
jgi:SAM-dependent methyltransferase